VKLPAATVGSVHYVRNDVAGANNSLAIFPQTGETIGGLAANASVSMKSLASAWFICTTAGAWTIQGFPLMGYDLTNNGFVFQDNTTTIGLASGSRPSAIYAASSLNAANAGATITINSDVIMARDAANVWALKNVANAQEARVYGTTTGPKYLSLKHDGTNGVIDTAASSGLVSIAPTNATSVTLGKKITSYNGVTAVGNGVPVIVGAGRITASNAGNANINTYATPAADGSYEISANVLVTTATTHAFTFTVAYTDEGNTARTVTMTFGLVAGGVTTTSIANANGAVPYMGVPLHIRTKASTNIVCATTGTFTTVTYNAECIVRQLN
jgi:hypothetical protein